MEQINHSKKGYTETRYKLTEANPFNAEDNRHDTFEMRRKVAKNIEGGYVSVLEWDKTFMHLYGFVQITARPYKQGFGCDGTTDSCIHLIANTICTKLGIDYKQAYATAYKERSDEEAQEWYDYIDSVMADASVAQETLIPVDITNEVVQLVLIDLYQINYSSLVEVLETEFFKKTQFFIVDWAQKEDELRKWKVAY